MTVISVHYKSAVRWKCGNFGNSFPPNSLPYLGLYIFSSGKTNWSGTNNSVNNNYEKHEILEFLDGGSPKFWHTWQYFSYLICDEPKLYFLLFWMTFMHAKFQLGMYIHLFTESKETRFISESLLTVYMCIQYLSLTENVVWILANLVYFELSKLCTQIDDEYRNVAFSIPNLTVNSLNPWKKLISIG